MNTPSASQAVEAANLLPCPFCGEKPELHSWQDTSCKDNFTLVCCARMENTDKSLLFSDWNNRADLARPQEVAAPVGDVKLPEPDTTWYASWSNDRVKFHSTDQIYEFANARVRAALAASRVPVASVAVLDMHTHWHHKSNPCNLYTVLAVGKLQTAEPVGDMVDVVIYQGPAGVWVRPKDEFLDGRFHEAPNPTPEQGRAGDVGAKS